MQMTAGEPWFKNVILQLVNRCFTHLGKEATNEIFGWVMRFGRLKYIDLKTISYLFIHSSFNFKKAFNFSCNCLKHYIVMLSAFVKY